MLKIFNNMIINTDNICSISGPDKRKCYTISMNNGEKYTFFKDVSFSIFASALVEMLNDPDFSVDQVVLYNAI